MALSAVQRQAGGASAGSGNITITLNWNSTPGSMVVLVLGYDNNGTNGADTFSSISDSRGHSWGGGINFNRDPSTASSGVVGRQFESLQTAANYLRSGDTITIAFSTGPAARSWQLFEVMTNAGGYVQATDGTSVGGANTTATITTASRSAGELVLGCSFWEYGTATFTSDSDTTNGSWSAASNNTFGTTTSGITTMVQWKTLSGAGAQTYNTGCSVSTDYVIGWRSFGEVAGPSYSSTNTPYYSGDTLYIYGSNLDQITGIAGWDASSGGSGSTIYVDNAGQIRIPTNMTIPENSTYVSLNKLYGGAISVFFNTKTTQSQTVSPSFNIQTLRNKTLSPYFNINPSGSVIRRNYALNPGCENSNAGVNAFTYSNGNGGTVSIDRVSATRTGGSGSYALSMDYYTGPGEFAGSVEQVIAMSGSGTFSQGQSASCRFWFNPANWTDASTAYLVGFDSTGNTIFETLGSVSLPTSGAGWTEKTISGTITNASVSRVAVMIGTYDINDGGGYLFYVDDILIEKASSPGTYFDGTTASCTWEGTAHASISDMWGAALTQVNLTLSPLYGMFQLGTKTVVPTYAINTRQNRTLSPSYSMRQLGTQTLIPVYDSRQLAGLLRGGTYAMRQLATKTVSPAYNLQQEAGKDLSPAYSIRTRASQVLSPTYAMRQLGTKQLVPVYGISNYSGVKTLTPIYGITNYAGVKTVTMSYSIRGLVKQTTTPVYGINRFSGKDLFYWYEILGLQNKTVTPSYNVRQLGSKQLTPLYMVNGRANQTLAPVYSMRQLARQTLIPTYSMRRLVSLPLTPYYDLQNRALVIVGTEIQFVYNMRGLLTKTFTPTYGITARGYGQTVTPSYAINGMVSKATTPAYDIRGLAGLLRGGTYAIRQLATKTLIPTYLIGLNRGQTLTPSYAMRQLGTKTLVPVYDLRQLGLRVLNPMYNLRQLGTKTTSPAYAIRAKAGQTLSPDYAIRRLGGKDMLFWYAINGLVQKTVTPSYLIGLIRNKTLVPVYGIRGLVGSSLSPEYTILILKHIYPGNPMLAAVAVGELEDQPVLVIGLPTAMDMNTPALADMTVGRLEDA